MARHTQPIAPVTIYRPSASGALEVAGVVQPTEVKRHSSWEPDNASVKFRLIAIQETGEELFAGNACTRGQALDMKYAWLENHPEHRDVLIESI